MNELEKISIDLNLDADSSEWGIINADADRVVEFINYYFENEIKESFYDYLNLVFDSMNDALLENRVNEDSIELFRKFVLDIVPKEQVFCSGAALSYWLSINEKHQDFPVVNIVKDILGKD